MTKKFKVVMTSTEKASPICILSSGILNYGAEAMSSTNTKPQHLYILSNEKIKEGDWFLSAFGSYPLKNVPGGYHEYPSDLSVHQNIVATTDKSIGYTDLRVSPVPNFCDYPQLPESFIQAYIKAYNEGKPITDVELEMVKCCGRCIEGLDECQEDVVKTSPDNTVIISESKMYSRDEVERLLKIALEDSCKYTNLKDFTDTHL